MPKVINVLLIPEKFLLLQKLLLYNQQSCLHFDFLCIFVGFQKNISPLIRILNFPYTSVCPTSLVGYRKSDKSVIRPAEDGNVALFAAVLLRRDVKLGTDGVQQGHTPPTLYLINNG